jgi:hypothetical protein
MSIGTAAPLRRGGLIVGRDAAGQTIIQLAVDGWVLEKLMTFDAEAAELEDRGDGEPDDDDEEDGPPVVVNLVRPKVVRRRIIECLIQGLHLVTPCTQRIDRLIDLLEQIRGGRQGAGPL